MHACVYFSVLWYQHGESLPYVPIAFFPVSPHSRCVPVFVGSHILRESILLYILTAELFIIRSAAVPAPSSILINRNARTLRFPATPTSACRCLSRLFSLLRLVDRHCTWGTSPWQPTDHSVRTWLTRTATRAGLAGWIAPGWGWAGLFSGLLDGHFSFGTSETDLVSWVASDGEPWADAILLFVTSPLVIRKCSVQRTE